MREEGGAGQVQLHGLYDDESCYHWIGEQWLRRLDMSTCPLSLDQGARFGDVDCHHAHGIASLVYQSVN